MSTDNQSQPASNLPSFAEALAAAQQMQRDWLEHGVNFVDLYVEDVDGDWLDQWGEDEPAENGSGTSRIESIVMFLMSDDPVAIAARPFWRDRPLPEVATHLERCLTLPEVERPYAVQDVLGNGSISAIKRNVNNTIRGTETLELAESLLKKLFQV